jgi:hypothetical protein
MVVGFRVLKVLESLLIILLAQQQEVELLRDIFKTKFDLDCTIQLLSKGAEEEIDLRINILFISKWLLCLN